MEIYTSPMQRSSSILSLKKLLRLLNYLCKHKLSPEIIMTQNVFSSGPYDKPSFIIY